MNPKEKVIILKVFIKYLCYLIFFWYFFAVAIKLLKACYESKIRVHWVCLSLESMKLTEIPTLFIHIQWNVKSFKAQNINYAYRAI